MNKQTSVYLNLVRFLAATVVFLSHVSGDRFAGGLFWQIGPYGNEAVVVFFILSGFVIAYVTDGRETTARAYVISRFARIYSVAFPALIVTFLLDSIGRSAHPDLYAAWWGYHWHDRITQFLANITFVNRLWFVHITPGSNKAFWSLGFEVWYYVIFGIAVFAPGRWKLAGVITALVLVGPKIVGMLPIWLLGVAAYYFCARKSLRPGYAIILCAGAPLCWIAFEAWAWHFGRPMLHPLFGRKLIVQDWVVGAMFALHLIGFRFLPDGAGRYLLKFKRPINWIAGATFTMYLFHLPVAQFLAAETPWPSTSMANMLLIYAGTPMIIFVIAEFTERRKDAWRYLFSAMLSLPLPIWRGGNRIVAIQPKQQSASSHQTAAS